MSSFLIVFVYVLYLVVIISSSVMVARIYKIKSYTFDKKGYVAMTILTVCMAILLSVLSMSTHRTKEQLMLIVLVIICLFVAYAAQSYDVIQNVNQDKTLKILCISNLICSCILLFSTFLNCIIKYASTKGAVDTPVTSNNFEKEVEKSDVLNESESGDERCLDSILELLKDYCVDDELTDEQRRGIRMIDEIIKNPKERISDNFKSSLTNFKEQQTRNITDQILKNKCDARLRLFDFWIAISEYKKARIENKEDHIIKEMNDKLEALLSKLDNENLNYTKLKDFIAGVKTSLDNLN